MSILQQRAPVASPGADSHDFRLLVEPHGPATVVAIGGELDLATVPALRGALTGAAERGAERLVIDLSEVTFVDSVGVGAVLHAKRRLRSQGRLAVVVAPASYASVIFETVGADRCVDVFATLEPAIAHVTG